MNTAELEIELLTPLSLPARSRSLDDAGTRFTIPGASLLGAAARVLHDGLAADDAFRIFQTAEVVFGDGLPVLAGQVLLPTPASLHTPKGGAASALSNLVDDHERARLIRERIQIDRYKAPFVGRGLDISATLSTSLSLRTSVTLEGRAAEGLLFTLQTLPAGLRFRAVVGAARPDDLSLVVAALEGELRLGRSRGSELGRVVVTRCAPQPTLQPALPEPGLRRISFLCVSSVALRDTHTGMPTFRPAPRMFGLPDAWNFDHQRSFIRTESYTPFHGKRGLFDIERHLIERGSVITFDAGSSDAAFEPAALARTLERGVGEYRSQGLGRVLVMSGRLLAPMIERPEEHKLPTVFGPPAGEPGDELFKWAAGVARQRDDATAAFEWAYDTAKTAETWGISMAQWGELRRRAREARVRGIDPTRFRAELERHLTTGIAGLERAWGGVDRRSKETKAVRLLDLLFSESSQSRDPASPSAGHPAARLELLAELTARRAKTKENHNASR